MVQHVLLLVSGGHSTNVAFTGDGDVAIDVTDAVEVGLTVVVVGAAVSAVVVVVVVVLVGIVVAGAGVVAVGTAAVEVVFAFVELLEQAASSASATKALRRNRRFVRPRSPGWERLDTLTSFGVNP